MYEPVLPRYEYEWDTLTQGFIVYRRNLIGQRWGTGAVYTEELYARQVCDFLNGYKSFEKRES